MFQYNQVADKLREEILAGRYEPATRLPTERALCTQYGVSRITIRQALALLESEQLIIRRQGSGTYVRRKPTRRIPLEIDFTGSIRDHAPTLTRELLETCTMDAPIWVAEELQLSHAAEVLYAERVDRLGEIAVAWDEVYILSNRAAALQPQDLERVDFIEAWCEVQHFRVSACRQRVEAIRASATDNARLHVSPNAPLLRAFDLYFDSDGKPLALFVSHYHPDYITVTSRYDYEPPHHTKEQP